ncbi:hypothetical protein JCM18237_27720 [Halorubrum luteum]
MNGEETPSDTMNSTRARSHVVGVALLIGITMVSLGALTAAVGTIVDSNAAVSDVDRVATGFDDAIDPIEGTGTHTGRVTFTDGELRAESRMIRVFHGNELALRRETDALVYDRGEYAVTAVAGAIVRDHAGSRSLARDPPVSASEEVVVLGVVDLDIAEDTLESSGLSTRTFRSDVTHERVIQNWDGEWTVSVETPTPEPWLTAFEATGASVRTGYFDGDTHVSVIATYEGERTLQAVLHRIDTEVTDE